jgi:hypothetical protein
LFDDLKLKAKFIKCVRFLIGNSFFFRVTDKESHISEGFIVMLITVTVVTIV